MDLPLRRLLPVLVVAVALVGAGVATSGGGLSGEERPPPEPAPQPTAQAGASPAPQPTQADQGAGEQLADGTVPAWLSWVGRFLVFGPAVGVVGLLLYAWLRWLLTERVRRRAIVDQAASQPGGGATDPQQVRDAVRAGLADIDAGGDTRRAVIACWLRLERIAAAAGTARLAPDTPGDLVIRLLSAHQVSGEALDRLADAYRLARYAPAEVGEEVLAAARQALREIDAQLAAPAAPAEPLPAEPRPAEPRPAEPRP